MTLRRFITLGLAGLVACAFSATLAVVASGDPPGPTASFEYTPTAPLTGEKVTFTSTSVAGEGHELVAWDWDLDDDGQFDDASGPAAEVPSFATAGSHTVSLQVTDSHANTGSASQGVLVVNRRPTASITATPDTTVTSQNVSFDASGSIDPDGTIVKYEWDLDGNSANGFELDTDGDATTARAYSENGTITASVRATDNDGGTAEASTTVTIDNRRPTASLSASPDTALTGDTIDFNATGSIDFDGDIVKYEWDLDGNSANGFELDTGSTATTSRIYADNGTIPVKVRVIDDDGGTAESSTTVAITNRPPTASLSISPNPARTGQAVFFDASDSSDVDGVVATYRWDLDGNGTFETHTGGDSTFGRSYSSQGTITVRVQVADNDGDISVATQTFTVTDRSPIAAFDIDPNPSPTKQLVSFDGSGSSDSDGSITRYEWDLDGNSANGFELDTGSVDHASRSYDTGGSYTVRLRVTDDSGNTSQTNRTLSITNQGPVATFTVDPNPAETGQTVNFDASASSDPDGGIAKYEWDLNGNGSYETDTGTEPRASQVYARAEPLTIRLKVTDTSDKNAVTTRTLTITNRPPTASFSVSPNPALTGQGVSFNAGASNDPDGAITKYEWDFDYSGDGPFDETTTGPTTSHSYLEHGPVVVRLRVTDDHGSIAETTRSLAIQAAPVSSFTISPNPAVINQAVTFDGSASTDLDGTISKWEWDLDGNGSFEIDTGSSASTSKRYSTGADVQVQLKVTDNHGNSAVHVQGLNVNTRPLIAAFSKLPDSPLTGEAVEFTSSSSATGADNMIARHLWDLDGDGSYETDTGTSPTVSHTYPVPELVDVGLQVRDSFDNVDFANVPVAVRNRPPAAAFNFAPGDPKAGDPVSFFSTSSDPDTPIMGFEWDLDGDGGFDDASGPSVTSSFAIAGSYTISLRATDSQGDSAIATQTVVVSTRPPAPRTAQSAARTSLLSPFPVVRLSGSIKRRGAKLRRFSVMAPAGATVTVSCRGRGCPFRRQTKNTKPGGEARGGTTPTSRLIRVRKLERRLLRAGIVLKVFVTKPGTIGKYTQFKMRRGKPPNRLDGCLSPGSTAPVQCPAS